MQPLISKAVPCWPAGSLASMSQAAWYPVAVDDSHVCPALLPAVQDVIAFPARAVRLMRFASRLPAHAVAKQIKKSYATKMAAASEQ